MIDDIAIVIAVHDNEPEIKRNLSGYLEQEHISGLQVIVVNDSSTDGTADVLKRMQATYPQLYTTFIPASSHRDRIRLALTVGAKAARSRWIALADICHAPESSEWIYLLSQAICGTDGHALLAAGACKYGKASLTKRYVQWRKNMKLKRKIRKSGNFDLPLNNVLMDKELIIRKGRLTASCDSAVWVNEARLIK